MSQSGFKIKALADRAALGHTDGEPCRLMACYDGFTLLRWGPRSRIVSIARCIRIHLNIHAPKERWVVVAQTDLGQAIFFACGPKMTEEERKLYHSE